MSQACKLSLLAIASIAIVTVVIYVVGFEKTWEAVQQSGPAAFVASGALTAVFLMLQAGALAALNPPIQHRVPFGILCKGATIGMAFNILTPSTYLGGEPAKVIYVGRKTGLPYQELAGTVVLAKYLEALSFILFFSFSTVVAAVCYRSVLFHWAHLALGITMVVLAALLLGFFAVLWMSLSRHRKPLTGLVGWLARLGVARRFFAKLRRRTSEMEGQVSRVFCEEGHAAIRAFGLLVLTHVALFVRPAVFFMLGTDASKIALGLGELSLIFVACQGLLALQITPSGAGTLDAGMIGTFALVGLAEPQCMAYLLCLRVWDAVVVGSGLVLGAKVGADILAGEPVATPDPVGNPNERPKDAV